LNYIKKLYVSALKEEEISTIRELVLAEYENESDAYHSTSEIFGDEIIDPADTLNTLGIAISASLNESIETPSYGIFRV